MPRTIRAAIVAAILALTVAAPAMAAPTSVAAPETLTVLATTSLTGVPASIAYGSGLAGSSRNNGSAFTMTASSNSVSGFAVSWAATDLTGPGTIAANTRGLQLVNAGGGTCATVGALSGYTTAPGKAYTGPAGTAQNIVVNTTAGSCAIGGVQLYVAIPVTAISGNYTGTTTFTVTET